MTMIDINNDKLLKNIWEHKKKGKKKKKKKIKQIKNIQT